MTSPFQPLECGVICQTEAEFSLKFVVTALSLTDEDEDNGFEEILVTITFDGNVIKIEDFKEKDEGGIEFVGRGLDLRLTPEQFSEKLRTCPIMFNLSRGCNDLGTLKLDISECFVDAPKCEEFKKQTCTTDLKFVKEGNENAKMTLVFQVSREEDTNVFKGLKKPRKLAKKKSVVEINSNTSTSISCSEISLSCSTDHGPLKDDETASRSECESFHPTSSSKTKSTRSKCHSDIATSLDIRDYSEDQHTFCNGCGKFSISGITCDNKILNVKSDEKAQNKCDPCKNLSKSSVNCKKTKNRICPECFEDLSVIPLDAPCPNCTFYEKMQRKLISFKNEHVRENEGEQIRDCIKSIVEEIFLDTKDKLIKDWQRLKRKPKKRVKKCARKERQSSRKSSKLLQSKPRCTKTLNLQRKSKFTGLRAKAPGVILGHTLCQGEAFLVPKNMGWLWNVGIYGLPHFRRGWKPGAVKKSVAKIMKKYLAPPAEPAPVVKPKDPPTLSVKKKQGEYTIVMNPLGPDKQSTGSPIVFKIEKSEEGVKRSKARKILKDRGVEMNCDCPCIETCQCLPALEKAHIICELGRVSHELCLKSQLTINDLKDTSDSEVDVEFTPPSAVKSKNPCNKKPAKFSYAETQYEIQDNASVVESEVAECKPQKNQKKEAVKLEGKTLKKREKSKELQLKSEKMGKAKAIKEEKVGNKSGKQHNEKGQKSKSKQQLQRKQKTSLMIRESLPKCCNFCAPDCEVFGCQTTASHRYTPCFPVNAQCPLPPPACARYAPIYY